jgi:hypothetical protein
MLIEGQFSVPADPEQLLQHLFDVRLMASCLPGCEKIEPITDAKYRAVLAMAMAGIKARFDLEVEITRRDANNVWATTRGEEGGRASTLQAESRITLQRTDDGTLVSYESDVAITGRLGRFALGMMKKKAQSLGDEFAANLQKKLGELSAPCAQPLAADALPAEGGALTPPSAQAEPTAPMPEAVSGSTMRPAWWQRLWFWLTGRSAPAKPASH